MKTAEAKTTYVATKQESNKPFFSKEAEGSFFGESANKESSFFKPVPAYWVNGNGALQTKLTIGQSNDKYEKEADAMADKVVQRLATPGPFTKKEPGVQAKPLSATITPLIQTKCTACEQEEKLQKKEEEDLVQESSLELQRKPIFESNAEPSDDENNIQRKCAECEKVELQKKEEELVRESPMKMQRKPVFERNSYPQNKETVRKKSAENSDDTSSSSLDASLNSSRGNGSLLSNNVRDSMESSFGVDFSSVRVHDNSSAAELNKNLHSQAFTHGSDIYFNSGKYDTHSTAGKHLLAHELTHVVQQGGASYNPSLAKKRIQRYSDYYWEPPAYNGRKEHELIADAINTATVVAEGPIPNAKTDRFGPDSDWGDDKKGRADFYTSSPDNTIIGLYFLSKNQPTNLPFKEAKLGGKKYSGNRAPVAYPGLTKKTPLHEAKKIPPIDKVNEAPTHIKLGEMKPIHSIGAKQGLKQLSDYKQGIGLAAGYVNTITGSTWNPSPGEISATDLGGIVPERFKKNSSEPYIENCILKGPQVTAGKIIDAKLKQERTIKARLVAGPDGTRPNSGMMLYAWVPVTRPKLRELPKRIVKLGKEVTDYIINPLKAPIKQKSTGKMGNKKEMPGQKPLILTTPVLKKKIQRKDDEHFDFETWNTHRKQLVKDFKALKVTDDYRTAMYTGQNMEANKLIEKHLGISQPAYEPAEKEATSGLKSIAFWANPLSVAFGYFKRILGKLFNAVVTGYEKVRGWIKGIANKFQFSSGQGGLIGSAFKAVFNLIKTVARIVISKVVDLLKLDVEKAIETKLNSLLEDAGLNKARKFIDDAMKPVTSAISKIEEWFGQIIEKYKGYFDEIIKYIKGIKFVIDIVNKIRWVARAIACVSPPLVGCLWSLALEVIERIASWLVETCSFRKKIAPIVLKWPFVFNLSKKLYQLIRGFLKGVLPSSVGDFIFPDKESTPEPAKESDIQCGSGSGGEGDGEAAGGELTPEQEAILKMQEDLKEEKFLALLELLKKAKIDGATKMSAERIRQLAEAVKDKSAKEIKAMADAYVKGDTASVPANIKEAIEQMAKDAKGKPSPVPDFDPTKVEQKLRAEEAHEDAAEVAKNLGLKEPTASEVSSSGEPALFLLNLMLGAKNESERLFWLKKGKLEFNQGLRDRLIKMDSVAIYALNIEVHINEMKVNIIEVKHDTRSAQQVSIVLDVTVVNSKNPLIPIHATDRTVQNVLWDVATQTQIILSKPQVIKDIVAGIQSNTKGLVDKEYNFSEIGFKAKLTRINKVDDLAELNFVVTSVDVANAGIYDYGRSKYITVKKGTTFILKENISNNTGSDVPVMPKSMQESNKLPKETVQKKSISDGEVEPLDEEEIVRRKCAECEQEDKEKKIQQRSENNSTQKAPETIETNLKASKGVGSPLPESTCLQMESSFGADFSNVRIHNNSSAIQMNKSLNSQAFTHSTDIYFNSGKYDSNSLKGKHLLAHELTHVLQQNDDNTSTQRKCVECEKEETMSDNSTLNAKGNSIQLQPDSDDEGITSSEPLPFTPDPKGQILPPQPTPGSTQKPDRSNTLNVLGLWWFHNQPIEETTKKLHPDRRFEYEDSIFFDYDSAALPDIEKQLKIDADLTDPKKPGGWLGRAEKQKLRITLRGNASEEGNPAYNLALSKKRIKAVKEALKHPNITIIKEESIFGKDKTIDFRRARRVDIVEEGVAAPAASPGDCKKTLERIMGVKSRSIKFLDKASLDILKALRSTSDKDSITIRKIVEKWFNKSDVSTMTSVAGGLSKISSTLNTLDPDKKNLFCQVTGKPPVDKCSEGVGARGGIKPKPHLTICSTMEKSDEQHLIDLFIHESGHAAGFMKDFAYAHERAFRVIDTESKLSMPDGFVGVTLEINNVIEKADLTVPEIGKKDEAKCKDEQAKLALDALALLDRWIGDAQTSVRELYDKSRRDFMPEHIATVRKHFDPGYNDNKIKITEALYARFEELSFPLRGAIKINCVTDLIDISHLGGFWTEDSAGFPGDTVFLLKDFFEKTTDKEKAALLMAEMLATASGFIEARHREAFAKMAQSFSKTQDKNLWRKKDQKPKSK